MAWFGSPGVIWLERNRDVDAPALVDSHGDGEPLCSLCSRPGHGTYRLSFLVEAFLVCTGDTTDVFETGLDLMIRGLALPDTGTPKS